ncbi:MAG: hypothetical protein LC808_42165 [Actinobacteria bacterium]|nr:hypothetical protein [Actinomycetota bacterium]
MPQPDLAQIIHYRMGVAGMQSEDAFTDAVVNTSQGLPHYTHLLAKEGGHAAVRQGRLRVIGKDFSEAIAGALKRVSATVPDQYDRSTAQETGSTSHALVLFACALAASDSGGTFTVQDVRNTLRDVLQTNLAYHCDIHLKQFSSPRPGEASPGTRGGKRGGILKLVGSGAPRRYRFVDPLLPPYVLLRARAEGLGDFEWPDEAS